MVFADESKPSPPHVSASCTINPAPVPRSSCCHSLPLALTVGRKGPEAGSCVGSCSCEPVRAQSCACYMVCIVWASVELSALNVPGAGGTGWALSLLLFSFPTFSFLLFPCVSLLCSLKSHQTRGCDYGFGNSFPSGHRGPVPLSARGLPSTLRAVWAVGLPFFLSSGLLPGCRCLSAWALPSTVTVFLACPLVFRTEHQRLGALGGSGVLAAGAPRPALTRLPWGWSAWSPRWEA